MTLFDKLNLERTQGNISQDDKLVVTAQDGVTTKIYYLSVLSELESYLAYVSSTVYTVNQEGLIISGAAISTAVTDFMGNLVPADQASLEVQDASGNGKVGTDLMAEEDMLQVTAGNGVNVVYYQIEFDYTGIEAASGTSIQIYPNPSSGLLNVAGVEPGSRIRVYNSVGVAVHDRIVFNSTEVISLSDQPDGIYFVTLTNTEKIIGRYKLILK